MSKFWDKVRDCKHDKISGKYIHTGSCITPECEWNEVHCLDCGAYITKCSCGKCNNTAGWSSRRRSHIVKKLKNLKHWAKLNKTKK